MKYIGISLLTLVLLSCTSKFRYDKGDVTKYKLYDNKVLILDTFTKHNKPYYKIETTDCDDCVEASDLELE